MLTTSSAYCLILHVHSFSHHHTTLFRNMKVLLHLLLLSILFLKSDSLTFTSKKGSNNEDSSNEDNTVKYAVRGAAAAMSKSTSSVNEAVLSFFESSEDPTEARILKDEISILANTDALKSFLVSVRRQLHKHPELMYQESFTSQTIQTILTELDISYTTGWAKNIRQDVIKGQGGFGIVAEIGTGESPCIILRADMDALPIIEQTSDVDTFRSTENGKMHACGHDGHTTMLLGAAAVLKKIESSIQGTVRLMFQPAEEGGAGGKRMVEEGVVSKEPKAELAFGMHVWPTLPSGTIASRPGTLMAATERFEILLSGKGGHAAMPHLTIDPIVATASLVMNLQPIVSRSISPLEAGVVSVTQVSAGDAFNVIPQAALIKGTIRALNVDMLMQLRDRVEHVVNATSSLHHCNFTIQYSPDFYPNTANDEMLYESFSEKVAAQIAKDGIVRDIEPTMGGEDFSFLAQSIPSTFFFIGQGTGGDQAQHIPPTDYGLHHPKFALDENIMHQGVELHVNLALRGLKFLNNQDEMASEL